jgi:hypothetical protein
VDAGAGFLAGFGSAVDFSAAAGFLEGLVSAGAAFGAGFLTGLGAGAGASAVASRSISRFHRFKRAFRSTPLRLCPIFMPFIVIRYVRFPSRKCLFYELNPSTAETRRRNGTELGRSTLKFGPRRAEIEMFVRG